MVTPGLSARRTHLKASSPRPLAAATSMRTAAFQLRKVMGVGSSAGRRIMSASFTRALTVGEGGHSLGEGG